MLSQESALVGREREQQQLGGLLTAACSGQGRLVLISGEAGIGKTTLVRDLVGRARQQGALVLSGACYDLTTTPPYGPWAEAIRGYRPSGAQPLPPVWFGNPDELAKIGSQQALFEETRGFFASVANHQPLVIVLEDLHWADPSSVDALRFLARTLAGTPVFLAATYRDDEGPVARAVIETVPMLVREASAERIELRRWNEDETRRLIEDRYQLQSGDEDRLTRYIHRLAEGNPFHTLELLRSLEGDGMLQPDGTIWQVGELAGPQVPPLVRQVVERRLERLPEETRSLLEIGALIGFAVGFDLWQAVSDADADRLAAALDQALAAQLIDELPDRSGFQFRHALVRETLYAAVNPLRLRELHRQVAERLIDQPTPDPDALAHHLGQAGDPRQVDWLIRAGERALRTFAWNAAAERFEAAERLMRNDADQVDERGWLSLRLGLLLRFSDQKESVRWLEQARELGNLAADRVLTAYTHFYIGLARHYLNFDGVADMEAGIQAISMLDESEIESLEARIERAGHDYLPGIFGLGDQRGTFVAILTQVGKLDEAIAIGEAFVKQVFLEAADQRRALIISRDAHTGLGAAYALVGRVHEARAAYINAYQGYRGIGNHWVLRLALQHELDLLILPYLTDRIRERLEAESTVLGAWQQAIQVVPDADNAVIRATYRLGFVDGRWREARHAAHVCSASYWEAVSRFLALRSTAEFDLHLGQFTQFWERVHALLPEGSRTKPGRAFLPTALRIQQLAAELCIHQGDLDRARSWLEANDAWFEWSKAIFLRAEGQIAWSQYHLARGDLDRARDCGAAARATASDPRQPLALSAARRASGEIETAAQNFAAAEAHLGSALQLAEVCRAPYEVALTQLAQAELAGETRDIPRAVDLLARVRATFDELGAVLPMARVERLEAALDEKTRERPAGLSPRETEILCLVADGLSNRDIAGQLFLSVRTVERHITNIYGKIEVTNRVEASAFVQHHHLTWPPDS